MDADHGLFGDFKKKRGGENGGDKGGEYKPKPKKDANQRGGDWAPSDRKASEQKLGRKVGKRAFKQART